MRGALMSATRQQERKMLRVWRMRSIQKFDPLKACVQNRFNQERNLSSSSLFRANRAAALTEWRGLCPAQGTELPQ